MNYSYQRWSKKASIILNNIILLQHVTDLDFLRVHQYLSFLVEDL